jgi:hypothetical protein
MTDAHYDAILANRLARRKPAQYTELSHERKFKQLWDWAEEIPPCDIMDCDGVGEFDTPTSMGPWGNLCQTHTEQYCPHGSTMGYHRIPKEKA